MNLSQRLRELNEDSDTYVILIREPDLEDTRKNFEWDKSYSEPNKN